MQSHQHHCLVLSPHSRSHPKDSHCNTQQPLFASPGRLGETRHHTEETPSHSQLLHHFSEPLTLPQETPLTKDRELLPLDPLPKALVQLEGLRISFSWALPRRERHSSPVKENWVCSSRGYVLWCFISAFRGRFFYHFLLPPYCFVPGMRKFSQK